VVSLLCNVNLWLDVLGMQREWAVEKNKGGGG